MKNVRYILPIDPVEKHIIVYYDNGVLKAELWPVDRIWHYIFEARKFGFDPLDIMCIEQNEYALGKGEVYGLKEERKHGLGRD